MHLGELKRPHGYLTYVFVLCHVLVQNPTLCAAQHAFGFQLLIILVIFILT